MNAARKFFVSIALMFLASHSMAAALGSVLCPTCQLTAGNATASQQSAAAAYVNQKFPSQFLPNTGDMVLACNGANCVRVVWNGLKFVPYDGLTQPDTTPQQNKNYINGTSGSVAHVPPGGPNGNYQIQVEYEVHTYNYTVDRDGQQIDEGSYSISSIVGISYQWIGGELPSDGAAGQ